MGVSKVMSQGGEEILQKVREGFFLFIYFLNNLEILKNKRKKTDLIFF
jgi:hypothetical protein